MTLYSTVSFQFMFVEKKQIRIAEKFRYTFLTDLVERDVVLFSQVSVYVKNDV